MVELVAVMVVELLALLALSDLGTVVAVATVNEVVDAVGAVLTRSSSGSTPRRRMRLRYRLCSRRPAALFKFSSPAPSLRR